ncbi:MAG: iron-containing alcohol dehydrogenase [Ruminococcus sp.]|nr:iron-containing alcohol dehydrogenase [Candidatus Copronaster equi]
MPDIFLPQKITYGENSLKNFSLKGYCSPLIISDCDETNNNYLLSLEKPLTESLSQPQIIVKKNQVELLDSATEKINNFDIDIIISFGSAQLIDLAMLLSYQSGADFVAVPEASACSMTDFENSPYTLYRKSPTYVVLDTGLIINANSQRIAYDAASCLAYAIDTLILCDNPVIYNMAYDGAKGILKNIIPAFRGEITARKNLMYSMYFAVAAHRNITSLNISVIDRLSEFFSQLGYSKQTVAAICLPDVMEKYESSSYTELYRAIFDDRIYRTNEECSALLIEKIRNIFASLSIPRSIKALGADTEKYTKLSEKTKLSKELLDICFYGSFKFIKL